LQKNKGYGNEISKIRMIKAAMDAARAMLIRRDAERNGLDQTYLQSFITTLETVDPLDSCVVSLDCNYIKKVTIDIPAPINAKQGESFTYVGPPRAKYPGISIAPYVLLDPLQADYAQTVKHQPIINYYHYINNSIYIYGNINLKYLQIEAVFANPSQVVDTCINSIECITDDEEYPLRGDLVDALIIHVSNQTLRPIMANQTEVETHENIINKTESPTM
jgi:hypothetical protein